MTLALMQSWELFGDALVTGLLLAAVLPLFGAVLVLRHQVFLAAAIGQSANLGIAVAIWAGLGGHAAVGHVHDESLALLAGLGGAVLTGVLAMRALSARGSALEARAVWTFLFAGSASMLLLADAPHGLQEVQRLMLSSLLGASPQDAWCAGSLLLATAAGLLRWRRLLLLWAMDPATARAHGAPVPWIDAAVGGWLGLGIGFAIHATGLTFTFGVTVLPVLLLREVARSLTALVLAAPLVGCLGYGIGFLGADRFDVPPGQATVAVLGAGVACAHAIGLLRGTRR